LGRVQGVAFRYFTQREASSIGIRGWVRNLSDGRVEALFDGSEEQIASMLRWCQKGPPMSKVTSVETQDEEAVEELAPSFDIRY
jgi:acylphosphatase